MVQKVIKIGDSLGVTIPNSRVKELKLVAGDEVKITFEAVEPTPTAHDMEVYRLTQKLIARHKQALKNLADK